MIVSVEYANNLLAWRFGPVNQSVCCLGQRVVAASDNNLCVNPRTAEYNFNKNRLLTSAN